MSPSAVQSSKLEEQSSEIDKLKAKMSQSASTAQQKKEHEYEHLTSVKIVPQRPISDRLQPAIATHYSPHLDGLQDYQRLHKESIEEPCIVLEGGPTRFRVWDEHLIEWLRPV